MLYWSVQVECDPTPAKGKILPDGAAIKWFEQIRKKLEAARALNKNVEQLIQNQQKFRDVQQRLQQLVSNKDIDRKVRREKMENSLKTDGNKGIMKLEERPERV